MGRIKTSLGIWAFGSMVTRFMPVGYQPDLTSATTAEKVHRAVAGLGDLIDDYEFHYPAELAPANLDEVRSALDGHGIYAICAGLHLDPRFGRGGLVNPDPKVRAEALRLTLEGAEFAGSLGAHFVLWPGIEGYNYPFQTPYAESWGWFIDAVGQAAAVCDKHGKKLFLEHKNSEPAMKILMRNIGMTLHVIHKLRAEGIDERPGQHGLAAPDHERRVARRVRRDARRRGPARPPARELRLGHVRRRQHGRRDGLHGDARARARAAPRRLRRERRAASASTSTRTPRTRSTSSAAACCSGTSSTPPRAASTSPSCARRSSNKDAIRAYELVYAALGALSAMSRRRGRPRRRHDRGQGARRGRRRRGRRERREQLRPVAAAARLVGAGSRRLVARERGGDRRARRRSRWPASGSRARCTASSRSTRRSACCGPRSSGTTSARPPSAPRSSGASASSG